MLGSQSHSSPSQCTVQWCPCTGTRTYSSVRETLPGTSYLPTNPLQSNQDHSAAATRTGADRRIAIGTAWLSERQHPDVPAAVAESLPPASSCATSFARESRQPASSLPWLSQRLLRAADARYLLYRNLNHSSCCHRSCFQSHPSRWTTCPTCKFNARPACECLL